MVYGDGLFEATGDGNNTYEFFESPDGINWNFADELNGGGLLFYANHYFATPTANCVSTNGIYWSAQDYPAIDTVLAFANGEFVIPEANYTFTSSDFQRWSAHGSNLAKTAEPGTYAMGIYVIYGNLISDYITAVPHLLYSTNAINWYSANADAYNDLYAVADYNGTIIAGGTGGLFIESTNGQAWTEYPFGTAGVQSVSVIFDISVEENTIVAADLMSGEVLAALNSTNGVNWTSGVIDSSSVYGANPRITFGNGTFVVSDGLIETSTGGVQWQFEIPSFAYIVDVAFANGLFVGVGYSSTAGYPGLLVTSTDGINWQAQDAASPDAGLFAVTYGNGQWLALGPSGTVAMSPDGTNWSTTVFGGPSIPGLTRLTFWNGLYVSLQETPSGSGGYVIGTSPDGYKWTYHTLPTSLVMYGLVFANHSLIAVGAHGAILQSDPLDTITIPPVDHGNIRVAVGGITSGQQVALQGSTNMTDWVTLTNLIPGAPSAEFFDSVTNYSQRFYRIVGQ
jgi:hypothetical protein